MRAFSKRSGNGTGTVIIISAVLALVVIAFVRSRSSGDSGPTTLVGFDAALPIDTALANAKQAGKPTLLFFTASWCPPCKQMKKEVLPKEAIANTIRDQFVGVYIDIDDRAADAKSYGISGVPTFIIMDKDGKQIARTSGGMPANEFQQFLTAR